MLQLTKLATASGLYAESLQSSAGPGSWQALLLFQPAERMWETTYNLPARFSWWVLPWEGGKWLEEPPLGSPEPLTSAEARPPASGHETAASEETLEPAWSTFRHAIRDVDSVAQKLPKKKPLAHLVTKTSSLITEWALSITILNVTSTAEWDNIALCLFISKYKNYSWK